MANNSLIIVVLLTLVLVLPVVFLATKTIACAFCQHFSDSVLPVAMPHHGIIVNPFQRITPSPIALRSEIEVLEEVRPVDTLFTKALLGVRWGGLRRLVYIQVYSASAKSSQL